MGYIPSKHAQFNDWQKQFVNGLLTDPLTGKALAFPPAGGAPAANWQNWGIPQADMQTLIDAQAAYLPLYEAWSDEDARNRKIVEDHKSGRAAYEADLRQFVAQWLRSNPKVSTGDKAGLGLTVPDTEPTPVTAVDYGPVLSIDAIHPLMHKIRVADPTNPHTQSLPPGQSLELQRFVGDAGLSETALQWSTYKTQGRFLIQSDFSPEQKGQTAYYRAFYLSTRGERSPASQVLELGIV